MIPTITLITYVETNVSDWEYANLSSFASKISTYAWLNNTKNVMVAKMAIRIANLYEIKLTRIPTTITIVDNGEATPAAVK